MARARPATLLLLVATAFAAVAWAQEVEIGSQGTEFLQQQLGAATARAEQLVKSVSALELALEDEKFQRATVKADLRAREDELEAAKLRAGELEREVADLKATAASAAQQQTELAGSLTQLKAALSIKIQGLEADLEARGKHAEAVSKQALELKSDVVTAQRAAEDARTDALAAEERAKAAGFERDAALERAQKAEDKASTLTSQQAERTKALKSATQKVASLEAALKKARSAAVEAEARADEASALTDRLLAEHYNEWVPHWVAYGYEKRVKPATAAVMETASEMSASAVGTARQLVRQGSVHGAALQRTASQKAGEAWRGLGDGAAAAWKGAGPTAQGYAAVVQKAVNDAKHRVTQRLMPPLMVVCDASRKAWDATQAHTAAVFKSDAVSKLRAQAEGLLSELEAAFAKLLAKAPPLAFLARPPYISYVTGAVLAAPLLTVLLPLLLLGGTGKSRKMPAPKTPAGAPREADTADSNGGGKRSSAKKARTGRPQ